LQLKRKKSVLYTKMSTTDLQKIEETLSKYNLPEEVQRIFWTLLESIYRQELEIAQLKEEINRLKGHPGKPEFSKVFNTPTKHKDHPKKEYKKEAEEFNAIRKANLPVDEIKEVPPVSRKCPKCSHSLHSRGRDEVKVQELEIKRKVLLFRLEKKQCPVCGYFEMGQIEDSFRGSSFGPELRSWISLLHYRHRLTEPQIAELLDSLGIVISPSEINHILLTNGKTLEPVSEQILKEGLNNSPYAHLDESGWKTKGVSKYLWTVTTNAFSYFRIHPKRTSEVANTLVSANPSIVSVSDDYSSYGAKFTVKVKQLCWLHEIRHYEKLTPFTDRNRHVLSEKLTDWWAYYRQLQAYRTSPSAEEKERLWHRFDAIVHALTPYDELNKRLALTAQKKERLLVCLAFPQVPPENNCAERALRHAVVIRKISRGSRSEEGERALTSHLTFFETCEKLGYDVKEHLKKALQQPASPNRSFGFT